MIARNDTDAQKIIAREVGRLRTSLAAGKALQTGENADAPIIVCLHFPPYFKDYACNALIDVMEEYGVRRCYFGHIHGEYQLPAEAEYRGITFTLISGDYLNFVPLRLA